MTAYHLDTSVALHALLGHSTEAAAWIDDVSADERHQLISSRLLRTELTRVLRREGLPVNRRDELLDVVALIPLSDGVLAAAEAIEPHLRTLDAVHLGSVIASGIDAVIVTHDRALMMAAAIVGYPTFDPLGITATD